MPSQRHPGGSTVKTRLYLLDAPDGNVVIEVVDHPTGGRTLDEVATVVDTISFWLGRDGRR